jgi:hypothetical protein
MEISYFEKTFTENMEMLNETGEKQEKFNFHIKKRL